MILYRTAIIFYKNKPTMKKIFFFALIGSLLLTGCKDGKETTSKEVYQQVKKQEKPKLKNDITPEQRQKLEELIQLLEDHPKSAKLYAERAGMFVEINEITQALQDISMAVDLDPNNPDYRTNKAQLLRQFKKNRQALEELDKALEIDPNHLGALFNRGALYFNTNKFEKALQDFSACIKAQPNVAPPYFNRAFTYEQLHDFEKAKADLKKFITLTDNPEWKKLAEDKITEWDRVEYKTVVKPEDAEKMGIDTKGMGMHE
jgi:tetratricopeptide (TPR) repeat protein